LRIKTTIVHSEPIKAMCYVGSADPAIKPRRYVRLQINPYSDWAETNHVAYSERNDGVDITYQKAARMVTDRIADDEPLFRYNPATVNAMFGGEMCFWIISSEALNLYEVPFEKIPHTPKMLEYLPPYEQTPAGKVSRDDNYVYDVEGEGTYLSRRARFMARYPDEKWAPFVDMGGVQITRYTVTPRMSLYYYGERSRTQSLHGYSDMQIVYSQRILIGKDKKWIGMGGKQVSVSGEECNDCVAFSPNPFGSYCIAGFPEGEVKKICGAKDVLTGKFYLDVSDLEGIWYVFPTPGDFAKYKWAVILTSVRWNNFLAHQSSEDTYQSKTYVAHRTLLDTRLREPKLTTWADKGVTRAEVIATWTQKVPGVMADTYVASFPHVVDVGGSFINLMVQTELKFPGERQKYPLPGLPVVDGHSVAEVYRYIIDVGEQIVLTGSSDYHLLLFGKWLRQLPFEVRSKPGVLQVYELAFNINRKGKLAEIPELGDYEVTRVRHQQDKVTGSATLSRPSPLLKTAEGEINAVFNRLDPLAKLIEPHWRAEIIPYMKPYYDARNREGTDGYILGRYHAQMVEDLGAVLPPEKMKVLFPSLDNYY